MKYLVIADIHGIKEYANKIPDIIKRENPDKIIILGDILYHSVFRVGDEEKSFITAETLNLYKDKIIGIRGNNDSPSDEKQLDFELVNAYEEIINGKRFYFTHGHMYNEYNIPDDVDVLVVGHTHMHEVRRTYTLTIVNPGSISLPRGGTKHSYMVIDDSIKIKDIKGHIIEEV